MTRKLAIPFAAVITAVSFVGCNSTYETVEETASSAAVRSFSFLKDDSVMVGLDSVFFSIDLVKGQIFNADSLPKGTKVDKLIPVVATIEGASAIQFTVTRPGKADTTYNYLTNSTDSIDFTNPVTLRIVSPDGLTDRRYTVTVNVHKLEPDSLTWSSVETNRLNTAFTTIKAQKTTSGSKYAYTLTSDGSRYYLGYTETTAMGSNKFTDLPRSGKFISFSFAPRVETLTALGEKLYILATGGSLYRSDDMGDTWTACGLTWNEIIGAYDGTRLLGITADLNHIQDAVSLTKMQRPATMPVAGFSQPVVYKFPMSTYPQLLLIGGVMTDGKYSADTWGFDGNSWAKISKTALPEGMRDMTAFAYTTFTTPSSQSAIAHNAIIAFGGRNAEGDVCKTVYISTDYGFNWRTADSQLQLPDDFPALYSAQSLIFDTKLTSTVIVPKIIKPTESWECPYIYIFGGIDDQGATSDQIRTGVINRLSFKPIE